MALTIVSVMSWRCAKENMQSSSSSSTTTLKSALNQNITTLSTAVTAIKNDQGYKVLTLNGNTGLKAGTLSVDSVAYKVNIFLSLIKGVYDYNPAPALHPFNGAPIRFFTKTADSSLMIVRMPTAILQRPESMKHQQPRDTTYKNNFVITVSDYTYSWNDWFNYNYNIKSSVTIDSVAAGNLGIVSYGDNTGYNYTSSYQFANGYLVSYHAASGDTMVTSYDISQGGTTLYEEKTLTLKSNFNLRHRENEYILTIGNVTIDRKTTLDSALVYVGGVLQTNAKVSIIDKVADPTASICKKRDIQITFADGTTTTVSQLAGTLIPTISTIFSSMSSVYFATGIVDWIAVDILNNKF